MAEPLNDSICGVYAIRCKANGKIYVGSSIDIRQRLFVSSGHRRALVRGIHGNGQMQEDFDLHGIDAFEVRLVHIAESVAEARGLEQYWLNIAGRKPGLFYNIAKTAICYDGSERQKEFELISPDGVRIKARGLKQFCREHDLDHSALTRTLRNPAHQHKGWRHIDHEKTKAEKSEIFRCNRNALLLEKESDLVKRRVKQEKRESSKQAISYARKRKFQLLSPTGEVVDIVGLNDFCKTQELHKGGIDSTLKNPRYQYKGWRRLDYCGCHTFPTPSA